MISCPAGPLLDRVLRSSATRAHRRPRGRARRRRCPHGRDQAQGGVGRAFGRAPDRPREIKKKFPLIEEELVQGGLWDPDAGLVIPRSQTVAGKLVDQAEAAGKLRAFASTRPTR
jgi:glycine/D-amino acid oxidase-like deaminating enzyme